MTPYWEIEQGSLEWFLLRWGKVGGSSAKGLFVNSKTLLYQLLAEQTEIYVEEESFSSFQMLRGLELEPEAIKRVTELTGIEFTPCGWIQSDIDIIGISPDGVTKDLTKAVEVKCLSGKKHIEYILEGILPLEYTHQCLHYFTVIDTLDELIFSCYRPESPKSSFIISLTPESEINLGTNAKPKMVSISDAVGMSREKSIKLDVEVKESLNKLTF